MCRGRAITIPAVVCAASATVPSAVRARGPIVVRISGKAPWPRASSSTQSGAQAMGDALEPERYVDHGRLVEAIRDGDPARAAIDAGAFLEAPSRA